MIINRRPQIISLSILAGLYCLSCVDGVSPRHCHTVRNCSNEEVCFTESHYSENGEIVFDTGCGTPETCHSGRNTRYNIKSVHGVDPHYHHSECLECCSSDLCNNQGCGQPGFPAALTRGPVCFDCQQVSHPMLCDKIRVCETNQECYLQKEVEFGDVFYATSCINKHACTSSLQIFGKRRSVHCSHCCQTDLCNNDCGASFSSTTITTQAILTESTTTEPLNRGSQGEEFLILFMRNDPRANGSEYAYILSHIENSSSVQITSSPHLEHAIRSNVDSIVNFTSFINIPFPYNLTCQYSMKEPKAVLLKISEISTIIIFDAFYKHSNDGTLIIPTRKLSTEYLVSTTAYSSQFAIGSFHSKTDVHIKFNISYNATLSLFGKNYSTGETCSISLEKFETIQIDHENGDLSGTFVTANKPFALFSGTRCRSFTVYRCSHMVSQIPPVREYDNEYIIPSFYKNVDTLSQIISPVGNIVNITIGANTKTIVLQAHEYHNFVISPNLTSIVKADHPVQVIGFAIGSDTNDPYMTVIPGIRHYLDYYKISVPENYTDNYLCVIIPSQSLGNLKINKLPVNDFTTVFQKEEQSSGKTYSIRTLSVSHGVYVLKTTDQVGFGLLVYGHKEYDGYGYAGNFVLP
ncbi:uncharacterized protein LOC111110904 [Crassostrea virginica]